MNIQTPAFSADRYIDQLMREMESVPAAARGALSRRSLFKLGAGVGGGLVLAFCLGPDIAAAATADPAAEFVPNAFLRISPEGRIVILSKAPEIGQGIKTAFPIIIAEELDAAWADVTVEQAPINPKVYGRQSAGGSRSIPASWDQLRQAGAVARAMLVEAAAKEWKVDVRDITTADSHVIHTAGNRRLHYGALAQKAAALPVPDAKTVPLKSRDQYKLIGTWVTGVDNHKLVTGQPLFGIDQKLPGMLYAAYEKCPAVGGTVASANLDYIKSLPGVKDAFVIEGNNVVTELMPGVAILADSTWAAFKAKSALQVAWDETNASKDSWSAAAVKAREVAGQPGQEVIAAAGDFDGAYAGAAKKVDAFYSYMFVAHAPLEPQNTLAWFKGDTVEIWSPTQTPERGLTNVASVTGLAEDRITLHQIRAGGGFGRRLMNDYMCEAVAISKQAGGVPVKLVWTREDDMRHDFFRPGGFHAFSGGLDAAGRLVAWRDHFITFTTDGKAPVSGGNIAPEEFPIPLVANAQLTQTMLPLATPCGPWRAPRSSTVAFAVQSFLHEMAVAAGRDHVEFLLEVLGEPRWLKPGDAAALNTERAAGVVKLAAEKAGWGRALPDGYGLGLAFHFSHAGHFAEVAEVSVDGDGRVKVHKVTVAGDIGPIINMSGAVNQCEGAVIDGLSTMNLQINIENGRIRESNFHEYPILRMPDAPQVEVHFVNSDHPPTGIGEPALPPVAPAIANAVFAATGQRLRSLPMMRGGMSA